MINVAISKEQGSHVEQFIEYLSKVRNLSENTLRSYQTDLLAFEQWCSREGVDVLQVDHRSLRLYLAYLKQAQYSAKTLNRHLSALRGFYKWMQREKLIATDPALSLSNPRAPRNLPHTMTDSDVNKLLESCDISTAVGLRDRAFLEFLYALGEERFANVLQSDDTDMITMFKTKYIERLREYYYVGGMPEVVKTYVDSKDFKQVREIQKNLLNYYRQDFSKHAEVSLVPRLNLVWDSIPMQLAKENKKYIYGQVRKGSRAKDFELALQWLLDCGLIHKVQRVGKVALPLKAYLDLDAFKVYLLDIGLLIAMTDLDAQVIIDGNRIFTEFKGALTEQYVLQQLIASEGIEPYYYSTSNSSGEIDFMIQGKTSIIPLEVKAEENLRAKSLKAFCEKYHPKYAVRTSMSDYREQEWMTNIPLYNIYKIREYVDK